MWEQIRSNQVKSTVLVIAMGMLLLGLGYALGYAFLNDAIGGLLIALAVWAIMSLTGYFQGDSLLLGMSGAKKIKRDDHPRLYNIVEEMKIAAGLEYMPDVYIIDDHSLNAFATGRDPKKASVAVTSGLLQKLNRDELQGVIAHEIGHIKNRDVLLMAMCSVLLGTIVIMAWYGSRMMLFGGMGRSRSSSGGGQAQLLIMILALALAVLAPLLAYLIYYAVSRKREYLADASSALYTRYPEGLASALEKLGASTTQLKSANKATAPMYIVNPFREKGMKAADLSGTHPPLSERIRILRAMSGGAFGDYNHAYQKVRHETRQIMPSSALAAVAGVPLRVPNPETAAEKADMIKRTRETTNALWQKNNYRTLECDCGARFRIPPGYRESQLKCPHCGRIHRLD
jgi:heat shock protein HtpX